MRLSRLVLTEVRVPNISTDFSKFQAGSFDAWGGPGFEKCSELLGYEFQRVFYKNLFSTGTTFLNLVSWKLWLDSKSY